MRILSCRSRRERGLPLGLAGSSVWIPVILVAALALSSPASAAGQPAFTNVAVAAGVGSDYYETVTIHSLGINWVDINNDDLPDMFMVNGHIYNPPNPNSPLPSHLYMNNGDGTFTNVDNLLPILPPVELSGSNYADYDNDGDEDIYIYTDADIPEPLGVNKLDGPPNILLKNLWMENGERIIPGQPLFVDVAPAAGVDDLPDTPIPGATFTGLRAKTAGWLDYDMDGDLDLFVGHWIMGASGDPANRDRLYRNNGDGTFTDVTDIAGLYPGAVASDYRAALAFAAGHLNDDLCPDMWVVNATDEEANPASWDQIYMNNCDGTFTEVAALQPGVGQDDQAGMGIDFADFNHDGTWETYISDIYNSVFDPPPQGNAYYVGTGPGTWAPFNSAPTAGVLADSSWGVSFFDVDQDTFEDFYVNTLLNSATGPYLYLNKGDGTFKDFAGRVGLPKPNGRGSAWADYDRDGDLDLATIEQKGSVSLWRNDTANKGGYLKVKLFSTVSNKNAIGTLATADIGSLRLMRQIKGGVSSHSQDEQMLHFGLGAAASIDTLTINWQSGVVDTLTAVSANQTIWISEGTTLSPSPVAHVAPRTLDFDQVPLTLSSDLNTRIRNIGVQDMTVTGLTLSNPVFSLVGVGTPPFSLSALGGSSDVTVRCSPSSIQIETGTLEIATDDPSNPLISVNLACEGVAAPPFAIRVNVAGQPYVDTSSNLFAADQAYTPGSFGYTGTTKAFQFGGAISGTSDPVLYQTMRGGVSFSYLFDNIPVGSYDITLHFTDPKATAAGQRVFNVTVEGAVAIPSLDIYAASGGTAVAYSTTISTAVLDGQLNIDLTGITNKPIISAIEVVAVP